MVLEETINKLAKDEDKVKYKQFLLCSYIEDNKKVIPEASLPLVFFVGYWFKDTVDLRAYFMPFVSYGFWNIIYDIMLIIR